MPGLVGIIGGGSGEGRRREIGRMVDCMHGKGRLESGSFCDEDLGVCVGWTSHPGSYAAGLPIGDAAGPLTVFFAGEHFAPDEENEEGLARRHGCSRDNASILLPLYLEKDEEFFPYLNGFFHGVIVDRLKRQIVLFNDRFGMQRLYYYEEPGAFYFASEAKCLMAVRSGLRAFDRTGLGEWLSCGAALENRSLFNGVRVLPGGSRWTWDGGASCRKKTYFTPEDWEARPQLEPEAFYSKLRRTFVTRLPSYLRSEGRLGMSATGGLDTRMILANLRVDRDALRCYTFCGPVRENLDVTIGRRVALASGFEHTTIMITPDFFKRYGDLAAEVVLSTDGNLELSGAPEIFVNEKSREISPIRLTGNYGSEVLRRHRSFKPSDSTCNVLDPELAESVRDAAKAWSRARQGHPLTYVVFKQIPWFSYNRLQSEQALLTMRSPFMDNELLEAVYQAPAACTESNTMSLRLIRDGNPLLADILTDRGVSYPKRPSWLITRAYYEFVFKMEYYAGHGMPRGLASLDKRLGPLSLERNFLGRNKYYHLRQWFRDELAGYVRELLLDPRTLAREYLKRQEVTRIVEEHLAGRENHTHTLDNLMTIELVNRLLFSL